MRRRPLPFLAGAVVVATAVTAPAVAQIEPVDAGLQGDRSAFILPIERTIVSLDGGLATTESVEEVTVTLEADVFFDFDEADLKADAVDVLADVAQQLAADGVTQLTISGHTDSVGTDAYNQDLSERRAAAVEAFLADRLDGASFTTRGFGATQPVAPNETEDGEDDPDGRALNRRVEIRYPRGGGS